MLYDLVTAGAESPGSGGNRADRDGMVLPEMGKARKNCKRTDAQIEILYWEGGSTLLMALPDHFHHGRIESYPESI